MSHDDHLQAAAVLININIKENRTNSVFELNVELQNSSPDDAGTLSQQKQLLWMNMTTPAQQHRRVA